ncbi:lactonase family protein [Actinoplanes sp. TRM 88003]|uniref:Lactonase family protein n=1 Tax=Paractinoplanes aksuensis TaxID=2939490 RepID=A0ABT1DZ99_9ACTN|nr:beta-propeller fold lactonase family protein [Actinoplanes aksuensis]MCO8276204.1 lactonase family protein [Actinoplanes aksuensis]
MRRRTGITILIALVTAAAAVSTGLASAHERPSGPPPLDVRAEGMVLVQSNDLARNAILAFRRYADGSLRAAGEFPTGGRGGAQKDNPFDPLASQDSLVFDRAHQLVIAVNAGSNSVTSFRVRGDRLTDRRTVGSGGDFPTSIAVSGNTVYVLNAGGRTNVTGFRIGSDGLRPLSRSTRELGVTNDKVPLFTDSPPQVGFSPDGRQLLVTTKSADTIEVFPVGRSGRLAAKPVVNRSLGDVPFSFTFDRRGHLLMTEAAKSGVTSYRLGRDGKLRVITGSVESGQQVLCWITRAGRFFYGTNPGSSTLSLYKVDDRGRVSLGGTGGVIAPAGGGKASDDDPGAGPIDMAATADGKLLYVQNTLAGSVEGFRVGPDGSLTLVTTLTKGLPVFAGGSGMEGIVAW